MSSSHVSIRAISPPLRVKKDPGCFRVPYAVWTAGRSVETSRVNTNRPPESRTERQRGARRAIAARSLARLRGVTLLEMMVVLGILSIVAAVAVPNLKPLLDQQKVRGVGDEVAGYLDRARRLAYGTGRCTRVSVVGDTMRLHRHSNDNCIDLNGSWVDMGNILRAPPGVTLGIENLDGSDVIIFRPSGRMRGTAAPDYDITNDGARVTVNGSTANRWTEVQMTANGRICGRGGVGGTIPGMPSAITCGGSYGGVAPGAPGGGCSAVHQESAVGLLALVGLAFWKRPRRRASRRPTGASRRNARRRGYLLIEVMTSGAILAVVLAGTATAIASSRAQITRSSYRAQAASFAQEWLQLMVADINTTCPTTDHPRASFTRTCATSTSPFSNTLGTEEVVTITVTYPNLDGSGTDTVTLAGVRRNRY